MICPVCASLVFFFCDSIYQPFLSCDVCTSVIDLRSLTESKTAKEHGETSEPVVYAGEIEADSGSCGCSAHDQLAAVLDEVTLSSPLAEETNQSLLDVDDMPYKNRFSFLYPLARVIERVFFGATPCAHIGNVRVFRRKIPLLGYRYFPVPRTSASYTPLVCIILQLFLCSWWAVRHCQDFYGHLMLLLFLMLLCYMNIFRLVYGDPGFILPAYFNNGEKGEVLSAVDKSYRRGNNMSPIESNIVPSQWQCVNNVPMERKWCAQCQLLRPIRAAHCYRCGLCVKEHDHHCIITGGCIGQRNVRLFFFFLLEGQIASFWGGCVTFLCLYYHTEMFSTKALLLLILFDIFPGMALTWTVTKLLASILYGFWTATTTRERAKYVYHSKKNPFHHGGLRNLQFYLWEKKCDKSILTGDILR